MEIALEASSSAPTWSPSLRRAAARFARYAALAGTAAIASVYAASAALKSPDLNSALPRSLLASAATAGSAVVVFDASSVVVVVVSSSSSSEESSSTIAMRVRPLADGGSGSVVSTGVGVGASAASGGGSSSSSLSSSGWRSAFTTPTGSYGDQCIERACRRCPPRRPPPSSRSRSTPLCRRLPRSATPGPSRRASPPRRAACTPAPRRRASVVRLDVLRIARDRLGRVLARGGVLAELEARRRAVREKDRGGLVVVRSRREVDGGGVMLDRFAVRPAHKRGVALLFQLRDLRGGGGRGLRGRRRLRLRLRRRRRRRRGRRQRLRFLDLRQDPFMPRERFSNDRVVD
eukprot:31022-Pelagococcus_subviridis.AAC.4